jgi:sphingomyelin phosphodiesterase acid-like 3
MRLVVGRESEKARKYASMLKRKLFKPIIFLAVLACFFVQSGNPASAQSFVAITDIHFDPYHNLSAEQFETLRQTPVERWGDFFRSLQQPASLPGQDSNYTLMASVLDAASRRVPEPLFVLYMGDFMAHDWQASYEKLAAKSIAEDPESYREFTGKSLALVAREFQARFPDRPVLATLGNDDAFCGDYWIQLSSPFQRLFAQTWLPLLQATVDEREFVASFVNHGAYVAELPGVEAQRLIVLNSVFWSTSYCDDYFKPVMRGCCSCEDPGPLPGRAQMKWLEQELQKARLDNKRVWLVMHVPPGLDSYAEDQAQGKCLTAEMWKPEFTARYMKLVEEYGEELQIAFAGHTHMDDFRIVSARGRPLLLHKIVPAVSPIFKNHSAFQVYQWDADHRLVHNWQTYQLDSSKDTPHGEPWQLEYDAATVYQLESVTAHAAKKVFDQARDDPRSGPAQAFARNYGVGAWTLADKDLPIYFGTILNTLYPDFSKELKETRPDLSLQSQKQALMRRPRPTPIKTTGSKMEP